MRPVGVLGIGQVPVAEHWGASLPDLALGAARAALEEAGLVRVDMLLIANMLAAAGENPQLNLGAKLADWFGLRGAEAFKLEAACGSGGAAFRAAAMSVASGEVELAMVVGVEKMSHVPTAEITAQLASASDADYEIPAGPSFVALNALIMQRYLHEYGWRHVDFAPFSINAHANAAGNPHARLREPISVEDYQRARMIATPINLLDSSPTGDGAAAIILAPASRLSARRGKDRVVLAASSAATDSLAIHDRRDPLWLNAAQASATAAYDQAGVRPEEIDFFELHDAFTIMAVLSLEACGFAERGQGPRLGLEGGIQIDGRLPLSTHGGLKARGHPVGASGVYQLVEAVRQLRGEAQANQLGRAQIGMTQSIGGSGASVYTHILRTE
jgi:acetyl-CoA C-acetyltransferase